MQVFTTFLYSILCLRNTRSHGAQTQSQKSLGFFMLQSYCFFFETAKFYGIFSVTTTRIPIFQESDTKVLLFVTVLDDSKQSDGFKHTAVGCGFFVKG